VVWLSSMLRSQGFEVRPCGTGHKADEALLTAILLSRELTPTGDFPLVSAYQYFFFFNVPSYLVLQV
jgi:hypothetical protein